MPPGLSPELSVLCAVKIISPDSVIFTPLAGCTFPWLVSIGAGIAVAEVDSPSTVTLSEFKGNAGSGIIPPFPVIFNPFLAADSLLASQACCVVSSGTTMLFASSTVS